MNFRVFFSSNHIHTCLCTGYVSPSTDQLISAVMNIYERDVIMLPAILTHFCHARPLLLSTTTCMTKPNQHHKGLTNSVYVCSVVVPVIFIGSVSEVQSKKLTRIVLHSINTFGWDFYNLLWYWNIKKCLKHMTKNIYWFSNCWVFSGKSSTNICTGSHRFRPCYMTF